MGFSVFTDVLIEELGLSRVQLSLAYCLGTVASGLTLPWLGRVLDRWGERRMAVASVLATGLVLFYLANCSVISQSLGQRCGGCCCVHCHRARFLHDPRGGAGCALR